MKQIDIRESTYEHLLALAAERGLSEADVHELADAELRSAVDAPVDAPVKSDASSEELIALFKEFRGQLRATTIADIVARRHQGLR